MGRKVGDWGVVMGKEGVRDVGEGVGVGEGGKWREKRDSGYLFSQNHHNTDTLFKDKGTVG